MGDQQGVGGCVRLNSWRVLVFILIVGGAALAVSIFWVFQRIDDSLGNDMAELGVALISILVLALIVIGMRAGLSLDRYLRRRRLEKFRLYRSSRQIRSLCSILGYRECPSEEETLRKRESDDVLALMEKPRRRGRPPTYSIDRWKKVVLAWESRNTLRNPLTLAEFLAEQFGVYADGSPRMSENSYYDWRKKVLEELRREVGAGQTEN